MKIHNATITQHVAQKIANGVFGRFLWATQINNEAPVLHATHSLFLSNVRQ